MGKLNLLIVEDNLLVGSAVREILKAEGHDVFVVENGESGRRAVSDQNFNVILLDLMLPDVDGQELLEEWGQAYPDTQIIVMTAYGDIPLAVECLKKGAYDFLTKPVEKVQMLKTLEHLQAVRKASVLTELSKRDADTVEMQEVIGSSPEFNRTIEMTRRVAENDFSCLFIKGESGTGKGLFARTIHKMGLRRDRPFVEVNCSALPPTLIESELFGHRKGAFTDAKEDRVGLFELADGGTLFLDEIGDMDIALQSKLLKVIEEQRFRRIGGTSDITVDVAIIAATNQRVEELIESNQFRLDLYYRLNVVPLELPPLRDRMEDVDAISKHFIDIYSRKFGKKIRGFSKSAAAAINKYSWPGNVRELRNVVERGCLLAKGRTISDEELMFPEIHNGGTPGQADIECLPAMPLAKAEELVIQAAMDDAEGNKNKAAKILGVNRTTLCKKLEKYGID